MVAGDAVGDEVTDFVAGATMVLEVGEGVGFDVGLLRCAGSGLGDAGAFRQVGLGLVAWCVPVLPRVRGPRGSLLDLGCCC